MSTSRYLTLDVVDEFGFSLKEATGPEVLGGAPLARVHVLENEFEAQVLMGVLEQEHIDAVVQTYREQAFDGLFIPQRGWGCIITREEDADSAAAVIADMLAAIQAEAAAAEAEGERGNGEGGAEDEAPGRPGSGDPTKT